MNASFEMSSESLPSQSQVSIHAAARSGDLNCLIELLCQGANPNEQDSAGKSSLHHAFENGHLDLVNLLLSAGASLRVTDSRGRTPEETMHLSGRALWAVGTRVDARDEADVWYEAQIVRVEPAGSQSVPTKFGGYGDCVLIHYRAWNSSYDKWYNRHSLRLAEPWSQVPNFRDFSVTREADVLTLRDGNRSWYRCRVVLFEPQENRVTLSAIHRNGPQNVTFNVDSESLAPQGTHDLTRYAI